VFIFYKKKYIFILKMEIIQSSKFQNDCQRYKKSRESVQNISKYIQKQIETNTKDEVQQVEESIKRLNKKIETIMKNPKVEQSKQYLEKEHKNMIMTLKSVMDVYQQAREIIIKDASLNQQQRINYLKKLENKMMDRLYSPQERENFKRMISNMIIMVPNQKMNISNNSLLKNY
jgi:ribosomal protein S13